VPAVELPTAMRTGLLHRANGLPAGTVMPKHRSIFLLSIDLMFNDE
jgi:hypothetical protein